MSTGIILSWKFFCDVHLIKGSRAACRHSHQWLWVLVCGQLEQSQGLPTSHCLWGDCHCPELGLGAMRNWLAVPQRGVGWRSKSLLQSSASFPHWKTMAWQVLWVILLCYSAGNTYLYKVVVRWTIQAKKIFYKMHSMCNIHVTIFFIPFALLCPL